MRYRKCCAGRVGLVTGILFLGSLITACDEIAAPQESIAAQIYAGGEDVPQEGGAAEAQCFETGFTLGAQLLERMDSNGRKGLVPPPSRVRRLAGDPFEQMCRLRPFTLGSEQRNNDTAGSIVVDGGVNAIETDHDAGRGPPG